MILRFTESHVFEISRSIGKPLRVWRVTIPSRITPRSTLTALKKVVPITFTRNRPYSTETICITSSAKSRSLSQHQDALLNDHLSEARSVLRSKDLPSEQSIQEALDLCNDLAKAIATPLDDRDGLEPNPTSGLLSLDDAPRQKQPPQAQISAQLNSSIEKISKVAFDIVKAPQIFINARHLKTYTRIQTLLDRPETFPHVFDLYATKSIAQQGTSPIQYKAANPNAASAAIPLEVASAALDSAIRLRDLPLCLSVINTSVCTTAYKRAKFVRRALLPLTVLGISPLAAYTVASQIAQLQTRVDPQMITNLATVGVLAYVGFTATIGIVAVTTANDQMERVTWTIGTPLRDRWMREDERAMADRIAVAWGFQSSEKRGEEEGEDWEQLREWTISRDMILDKPELMDAME